MSIIPLIAIVTGQVDNQYLSLIKGYAARGSYPYDISTLVLMVFMVGITFASIVRILTIYLQYRISHLMAADIAARIFDKFLNFHSDDEMVDNSSNIVAMVTNKVDRVNHQVLLPIIQSVSAFMLMLTFSALLISSLGAQLFIFLAGAGAIYVGLFKLIATRLKKYGKLINRNQTAVVEVTQEAAQMFRELKVYRLSAQIKERFNQVNSPLQRSNANLRILSNAPRPILDGGVTIVLAIAITYYYLQGGNLLELGPAIAAFALMGARLLPMAQQLFASAASFRGGYSIMGELVAYLQNLPPPSSDSPLQHDEKLKVLELSGVSFSYDGKNNVLSDINLRIEVGQKIGILGESGSGKSTLLDIILGLRKPSSGRLFVNDSQVNLLAPLLERGVFSYVPQSVFLFNQSLERNIALESTPAPGADVLSIINKINLKSIDGLSMDPQKSMGELGKKVSGGQRQKIGIARSLYQGGTVHIFDEVTSALDFHSEKEMVELFQDLPRNDNAYVFVTHRPALLAACDTIYRLENGTLILMKDE